MDSRQLRNIVLSLKIGGTKTIYKIGDIELYIHRPEKLGASLKRKDYDVKRNFQILMKRPGHKDFKPNHLRVLLDLHLKKESDPKMAKKVFDVIEKVYDGKDPLKYSKILNETKFRMSLDSALVNVCCVQLFMMEQEINYTGGKVQPPRAFIMGYIRMIASGQFEIDKLLWSSTRNAPQVKFYKKDKESSNSW